MELTSTTIAGGRSGRSNGKLEIALPQPTESLGQDAEWCVVRTGDRWRQIRFHDYDKLFSIPGLYEKVIYEILRCRSPEVVAKMLAGALAEAGESPAALRVLDLGAGNGMVAEELARMGVEFIAGVDIIDEAAEAARRDRPGLYDAYHVLDLSRLSAAEREELAGHECNCLVCVAALGFGDIPPEAFLAALDLISTGGWIAFNIKEDFLDGSDPSGFARLIRFLTRDGKLTINAKKRYCHRLGTDQSRIHYVAIVGRKTGEVPRNSRVT